MWIHACVYEAERGGQCLPINATINECFEIQSWVPCQQVKHSHLNVSLAYMRSNKITLYCLWLRLWSSLHSAYSSMVVFGSLFSMASIESLYEFYSNLWEGTLCVLYNCQSRRQLFSRFSSTRVTGKTPILLYTK